MHVCTCMRLPMTPTGSNRAAEYGSYAANLITVMDDRLEKQAALAAISGHKGEILRCCDDAVDLLDALEELEVMSQEEKDNANEHEDYELVVPRLTQKIEIDPSFFNRFCHHIHVTQNKELSSLAEGLVGELTQL